MIKLLVEGKQVGEVSYMVADLDVLLYILDEEMLLRSRLQELNPKTRKKEYYLSLSRNLTSAAKRNSKRWRWGVILNGDKLSDRYSITPVSYSGIQMSYSDLRVTYITAYDNGTYALNLVNWPTIEVNEFIWDKITKEINNLPEEFKEKKKLQHTYEGRNTINGRKVKEKYLFNVKTGGLKLNYKDFPEICSALDKNPNIDETEERIWIPSGAYYIDIHNCIEGVIAPKNLTEEEQKNYIELERCMSKLGITRIITV